MCYPINGVDHIAKGTLVAGNMVVVGVYFMSYNYPDRKSPSNCLNLLNIAKAARMS